MAAVKKVIVVGNGRKPRVPETVERAVAFLRQTAEVVAVDLDATLPLEPLSADMVFVFGGDGAILQAVRQLGRNPVPVCGVNLGKLGFLATLTDADLARDLGAVLRGEYTVLIAALLDCFVQRNGEVIHRSRAVNDAVVSRGALSRIIPVDLLIDGDLVTTYNGDGLIISSPLGSTAHSLSAGGPIVAPDVQAMILTPICPHTLTNRPIVIPAGSRIDVKIGDGPPGTALTVDGQVFQELQRGDIVSVMRSAQSFRLVRAAGHDYYRTLREKLGWKGHLGASA